MMIIIMIIIIIIIIGCFRRNFKVCRPVRYILQKHYMVC